MSEQQSSKQSASDVIIHKIHEMLEDLRGVGDPSENYNLRSLGKTSTLLGVLREIEATEEKRAELLAELQQVVRTWKWEENTDIPDTIEWMHDVLSEVYDQLSSEC